MKRLGLILVAGAAMGLIACQNPDQNQKPQARPDEPARPLSEMDASKAPPPADPYAQDAGPMMPPSDAGAPRAAGTGGKAAGTSGQVSQPRAKASRDEPQKPAAGGKTYTTQKGDSFYKIAQKFYKDGSKWKKIWEANKARVPNPDKLPVGTKLVIP